MFSKVLTMMVAVAFLLSTIFVGCSEDHITANESLDYVTTDDPNGSIMHDGTVWPFESEDPETGETISGILYLYGSLHGKVVIDKAVKGRGIQSQLTMLGRKDYQYISEGCKVIETIVEVPVDTGQALHQTVILTMDHMTDTTRHAYVSRVSVGEYCSFAQSGEIKYDTSPDDTLFYYVPGSDRDLWVKEYPAVFLSMSNQLSLSPGFLPPDPLDPTWDSGEWLKCVLIGGIAGCGASAVGCLLSAVAWPACTTALCWASFAGAEIACTLDQVWDWLGW